LSEGGPFRYRAEVLDRLWAHGVQPSARTRPDLVRDYVRDLYKYEIRSRVTGEVVLKTDPYARPMEMRGKQMTGWLRVDTADVRTKRQLAAWVDRGVAYARSLPKK
jgi:hypothetical protein